MESRISVIIPTYNRAEFILGAVESVLAQSWTNIELIVVDDGSTDDTCERLRAYAESGRLVYFFQQNQGVSVARNTGLRMASGEFVKFLDSDDLLLPNALEALLRFLEKTGAHVGVVFADYFRELKAGMPEVQTIHEACQFMKKLPDSVIGSRFADGLVFNNLFYDRTLVECCINLPTALFRRAALSSAGEFDSSLASNEDWEYFARVASLTQVACHFAPLAIVRFWINGLTNTEATYLPAMLVVLKRHLRLAKNKSTILELRKKIGGTQLGYGYTRYRNDGDVGDARRRALKALRFPGYRLQSSLFFVFLLFPARLRARLKALNPFRGRFAADQ